MTPAPNLDALNQPGAAPPAQAAPTQQAPATPVEQPTEPALSDEGKPSVNLKAAYSRMNESLIKLADGLGVPRTATVPHLDAENMGDHIAAVGDALRPVGGVTKNLLNVGHTQHGSGETVAHAAEQARTTLIPKDDENAKAAIRAAKSLVNKVSFLIGEDPTVKVAKSQLAIVGKSDGEGMTVESLMIALHQIVAPVIQSAARQHNDTKPTGPGHPLLSGPFDPPVDSQAAPQNGQES